MSRTAVPPHRASSRASPCADGTARARPRPGPHGRDGRRSTRPAGAPDRSATYSETVTTVDDPAAPPGSPGDRGPSPSDLGEVTRVARALVGNVERVVRGRREAVELVTVALLAGGHVVVEDVPGTGKTTLARAVARSVGGSFHRVQATADLLPADITGSSVWDPSAQRFTLRGRAGLRARRARRRAQPDPAAHPVGVPRGDGRGRGDRGRRPAPGARPVLRRRHPEPARAARHLPAAGGPARPVRGPAAPRRPRRGQRAAGRPRAARRADRRPARRRSSTPTGCAAARAAVRTLHVADPVLAHALTLVRAHPGGPAGPARGEQPGGDHARALRAGPGRCSPAATT